MKEARILIVDDEHNTREAMARYLKLRFEVSTAADGAEAIEKLRHEDFDLVLTDLRMPQADGMSVLDAARSKACRPACILLTAYGSISDAVTAVKHGAFDFIPKPVDLDVLEKKIQAALTARRESAGQTDRTVPESVRVSPHRTAAKKTSPAESAPQIVFPSDRDNPMHKIIEVAEVVAPTRSTVLLTGESGTGKEVVARFLHDRSGRTGYFIDVHCAALAANLIESELFGHEKGAFTGAAEQHKGKFERADHGTLFFDEIGEIDLPTQVKLLRFLETRQFERVGGTEPVKVDVRIIAATNRDLRQMVAEKTFREDLYYRLSVVNLELPPLRERVADIPRLVEQFVAEFDRENGRQVESIAPEAMKILLSYPWPGNIRELRNCVEYMVVLTTGKIAGPEAIPENIREGKALIVTGGSPAAAEVGKLEDTEWSQIERALERCGGNRTRAAELLGISRRTLHRRLSEHEEK